MLRARRQAANGDDYDYGNNYDDGRDHDDERRPCQRYNKRRDGCYDSVEDRGHSLTADLKGPRAFGQKVRDVQFPLRFRAPTTVLKYDGETNPSVWFEDYKLACHAGGATGDLFIIKNLSLYLVDSARTWLEHLPHGKINS
jgi:hypothetical protein